MDTSDNIIKKYENVALSNIDILQLLDNKANIVLYPKLYRFKNIDQILEPYEAFVLLFEAKPKYGHWTCIFKVNNNTLEFFNPYGGWPDDSLSYISTHFREKTHQDHTYLSELLLNSNYQLTYNQYKFQEAEDDIKTCGRHCVMRLIYRHLTLDQYYSFLVKCSKILNMNFDELVTLFTTI